MKLIVNITSIILLILSASGSIEAQSQSSNEDSQPARLGEYNNFDTSIMECVYEHATYDPIKKSTQCTDWILEIGKNGSKYSLYPTYQCDSIINADYNGKPTRGEYYAVANKFETTKLTEQIKNLSENKFKNYESIFMDWYYYEEPIPQIEWNLVAGTDEICGHECKKATTTFRGRNWTAWYTEEIPIDNGPWKFGCLPGLILKVEDDRKEHVFEAMQLRKSSRQFGNFIHSFIITTDRQKFNKMMRDYKWDAGSFISNSPNMPTVLDGTPAIKNNTRLFYNPIELDWE